MIAWQRVLVHHSATHDGPGVDFAGIRNYHTAPVPIGHGWQDIGYHSVVELVGSRAITIPGRPVTIEGAHCPGQNRIALGLCVVGNFDLAPPSHALLAEAADTIAGWCVRYSIPVHEIRPHREFRSTHCPGALFPINDLRARVERVLAHG